MIIVDKYKVSFPRIGNYYIPMELLFTEGLGVEYVLPPPITKKTLELGSRYSPDYVCAPFKYNLGSFIETIEAGANTIIQTGGVCRLGYYGELHEAILRELNYDVRFINMAKVNYRKPLTFYNYFKEINPDMSLKDIALVLPVVIKMVEYMDEIEDFIRKNIGFEAESGSLESLYSDFLYELDTVRSKKELNVVYSKYVKLFKEVPVNKPKNPLRVGIIGEYYTIMEPFSNHYIEKELGKMGIVVDRWLNITNSLFHSSGKDVKDHIRNYAKYNMGATSMHTINKALEFAKKRYDGIIHLKSFGCTPEMDAMPVLQNISADYKIPILYFSFDSQTSDTGIKTRLEAFYDMIIMRKEAM
jgi:predicted nucleotide-binding protein (sugar kinase/HSP70/actin superfamily)